MHHSLHAHTCCHVDAGSYAKALYIHIYIASSGMHGTSKLQTCAPFKCTRAYAHTHRIEKIGQWQTSVK